MKKSLFLFALIVMSTSLFAQEDCTNGIDDDGDGLIDLNDEDCDCGGFGEVIESLIPNLSFEDYTCCPDGLADLDCAVGWTQASDATSEYYNHCDFDWYTSFTEAESPLPGGGDGFVGFHAMAGYLEYIGTMLSSPLIAGTEYTLNLYTAWGAGSSTLEFSIFGTPTGGLDLPWSGVACPVGSGSWELLGSESVTYVTDGSWQVITIIFIPSVDMDAVAIGGPCVPESSLFSYYYADELVLIDSESFSDISETGDLCDGDLMLSASTDTIGGTWQWYKDGIALTGETDADLDVMLYGLGDYSAVYFIGDNCKRVNHTVYDLEGITADFEFTAACVGEEVDFTNTSVYGSGVSPTWEWDFGGDGTSTDENPSHTFSTAGTYTIELIAINDVGCNDTLEIDITIDPIPVAGIEFIVAGVSSEDGGTGGCIESTVQFNDISTIASPGIITEWDWNFGDSGTSTEENPTHDYDVSGTYTVTLTVRTSSGCSSTITIEIIMTNGLALDLIYNEPTCYGYSDGSVTVNVTGGAGDLLFNITDEDGETRNVDNSNTANTLNTGWYYINVSDDSECDGIDSIFIDQPDELAVELTVTGPLCFGLETGYVLVDTVFNSTGDYDGISYIWTPNPGGNSGLGEDSTGSMGAGDYTLTINDQNGCTKTIDFIVDQPDSMFFPEFGTHPAYCRLYGYQNGQGVVYGAATGGTGDKVYQWTNLDTEETSSFSTWGGLNPGTYKLVATDAVGCTIEKTVVLDSLNPIADFTVTSDQLNSDCQGTANVEVTFDNISSNFYNEYDPSADSTGFWNLDTLNTSWWLTHDFITPIDTIYRARGETYDATVCLTVVNSNGCSDTKCKLITIYEPIKLMDDINIFTPNGDGKNDLFTFRYKSASISKFHCTIVNRWGILMTELNAIEDGWDGTDINGDPCADGVYFFNYTAVTDDDTKLAGQGTIQLIGGNH